MPSLDEFYRFIEKKEQTGRLTGGDSSPLSSAATVETEVRETPGTGKVRNGSVSRVRYVMRGGITVAEPVEESSINGERINGANGSYAGHAGHAGQSEEEEFDLSGAEWVPALSETEVQGEEASSEEALAMWRRLPRHIQLLASIAEPEEEEVARKYYTRDFKETRQQLIQRLLNPTLTLEETARVLGVCPATVRRYTNRGVLPHFRTIGQQRRFRLSDVLIFLERQEQQSSGGRKTRKESRKAVAESSDLDAS